MAVHHGKTGKIKVGSNVISALQAWSINENVGTSPTTAMGDSAQTHLVDIPGWTGSFDCHLDHLDTMGQAALAIGASITLGVYSNGDGSGKKYFSGTASITSIDAAGALTGAVTRRYGFMGNGALTIATAS